MATDRRASWLKGVLDLLVLACLRGGESYGYEIARRLDEAGLGRIKGGTLYPVLNRLEEAGLVEAEFRATERGPGRRYYRLTEEGREGLRAQGEAWLGFHGAVRRTLVGGEPGESGKPGEPGEHREPGEPGEHREHGEPGGSGSVETQKGGRL